jgi:hypothetical protein
MAVAGTSSPDHARIDRLGRVTRWLDDGLRIPGTRFRVGLDPLLGLVPAVGDAVGALLGTAILVEAVRAGVPRGVLFQMVLNIAVDTGVGTIPVFGDIFDTIWKANRRNLTMLEQHVGVEPGTPPVRSRAVMIAVGGLIALGVLLTGGAAYLTVWLLGFLV